MDFSQKTIAPLDVYIVDLDLTASSGQYWLFWVFEIVIFSMLLTFYSAVGFLGYKEISESSYEKEGGKQINQNLLD